MYKVEPSDFVEFNSFANELHQKLRGPDEYQLFEHNGRPFTIEEKERKGGHK